MIAAKWSFEKASFLQLQDYSTESSLSPIYEAARCGHAAIVQLLLDFGAEKAWNLVGGWVVSGGSHAESPKKCESYCW